MSRCPSTLSFPRVIQMIDENKEQLRNLFRNYNVLDVQPAITARAPDDLSALQVMAQLGLEVAVSWPGEMVHPNHFGWVPVAGCWLCAEGCRCLSVSPRWQSLCWLSCSSWLPCSSSS